MKRSKKLLYALLIILPLAIVLYIGLRSGDLPASLSAIRAMPPAYVFMAVMCTLGGIGLQALSCKWALEQLGYPVALRRMLAVAMLGEFYSNVTPGASGGQPMQIYQFHRDGIPAGASTAALTIHFHAFLSCLLASDLVFYIALRDFIDGQIGQNRVFLILGVIATAAQLVGSLLIAFYQRPIRFLVRKGASLMRRIRLGNPDKLEAMATGLADGYFEGMRLLVFSPRSLARQLICGLGRLILLMSVTYLIYRGLGQRSAGYLEIFAMGLMQYTSAAYTPLPGASGAQEGIFGLYFSGLFPGSLLLSALLCWRFITYYLVLILGAGVTAHVMRSVGRYDSRG